MLTRFVARHRQTLSFLVAGGINTAFGLALYPALLSLVPFLHDHYLVALGIAQLVSVAFAFAVYKTAVFRTRANIVREFIRFASFYSLTYLVNWIVLPLLVEIGRVKPIPAQVGFAVLMTVASYFWHSRLTFRRQAPSKADA